MAKIVIIGASISANTVALSLRAKDKDCAITLITEENYPLYDRRKLPDFLKCDGVKEEDLFIYRDNSYSDSNINFLKNKEVTSVNLKKKIIYFHDKTTLGYDFLVVACGLKIVPPEIPGVKKEGVFALNSLDDFKKFSRYFINEQVCLVGSDITDLNLAKAIAAKYKVEVKLLSRARFDLASLPLEIEVLDSAPQEIIGEGEVQAVKLDSGKIIAVSAVIFREKLEGNTDFLKDTGIERLSTFIVVDSALRTNSEEVFACGAAAVWRGEAQKIKDWDDCIREGVLLAEEINKAMKGETCQKS